MATKTRDEESQQAGEVPMWFVTYSDVITLLMTFFILLLTFATSEPEKYERIPISAVGSTGSAGLIRDVQDPLERDSFLVRVRTEAGRLATRGSESPPVYDDPGLSTLSKGLKSLEKSPERLLGERHTIHTQLELFIGGDRKISQAGQQWLRMIAHQMRRLQYDVQFQVDEDQDLESVFLLARYLVDNERIAVGRISMGNMRPPTSGSANMSITLDRIETTTGAGDIDPRDTEDADGPKQEKA